MSNKNLDVLTLGGDQVVTATKNFILISIVEPGTSTYYENTGSSTYYRDASTYSRRRRSVLPTVGNETCGFHHEHVTAEGNLDSEELLWSLGRVTAARDLIGFLHTVSPGTLNLTRHYKKFLERLTEDVACAFTFIEDKQESITTYDLHNLDWRAEGMPNALELSVDGINSVIDSVEKYEQDLKTGIASTLLTWRDALVMFIDTRMSKHYTAQEDLGYLEDLISTLNNSDASTSRQQECQTVCSMQSNKATDSGTMSETCLPGIIHLLNILRRISLYPSLITTITQLSGNQRHVLQTAVIENGIKKVLEMISEEGQLKDELQKAKNCNTEVETLDYSQDILEMLEDYKQELEENEDSVVRRTKRSHPAGKL